jgi:2-polyprenyl-6-methoxyphenol hydroxylase-like FAD-dependent oxidoreductase
MVKVAIVGTGISGLTLALRLQQLGIDTTVYAEKSPDDMRTGRLPNTVARFEHTLERERRLGVEHWPQPDYAMTALHFASIDPLPISFVGRPAKPVRAVDFRVLLPQFLEDYTARGGRVVVDSKPDITTLSSGYDLVVAAVGRGSLSSLFPVDPARSPYAAPQRVLFAGIFDGLDLPDPIGLSFNISPGVGEVFQMPIWTASGLATNILVEAIPTGPLAVLSDLSPMHEDFLPTLANLLEAHAPAIAERVDRASFALRGPLDCLQGALTPAVRHPFARLPEGTPVLAIGDAWITNDPITGQGANLGSHCAWVAADHIANGGPFDAGWGSRVEEEMWRFASAVTGWTNAFLQPPPPQFVDLLIAAASDSSVAGAIADLFAHPTDAAGALSTPEAVQAFIASARKHETVGAAR